MKIQEYDRRTAMRFVIAAGVMLTRPSDRDLMEEPLMVIFTLSTVGLVGRREISRTVREQGKDVVHLEFEPWREGSGPSNLIVCEGRGSSPTYCSTCSLWTPTTGSGPASIVPRDANFSYAFDGLELSRVAEVPDPEELTLGAELARETLITMASRVPQEMLRQTMQ